MLLGLATDTLPAPAVVAFWKELLPGVPWASHAHPFRDNDPRRAGGLHLGRLAAAFHFLRRDQPPRLEEPTTDGAVRPRRHRTCNPLTVFRLIGEHNIGGDQRGFARFGADFWPVIEAKGEPAARVSEPLPQGELAEPEHQGAPCWALGRRARLPRPVSRHSARASRNARPASSSSRPWRRQAPAGAGGTLPRIIAERNRAIVMGLSPHKEEGFLNATS